MSKKLQFITLLGLLTFSSCANNDNKDSTADSQEIEAEKQKQDRLQQQYEDEEKGR